MAEQLRNCRKSLQGYLGCALLARAWKVKGFAVARRVLVVPVVIEEEFGK